MIRLMKKLIGAVSSITTIALAFPSAVFAATNIINCGETGGQFLTLCNVTTNIANFGKTFGTVVTFVFIVAVIIALGFLVFGGIKWVTSGGEKTGVEEARNHVVAAVVGLIIVFLSYFVINLVVYFFTGASLFNITIPTLQ